MTNEEMQRTMEFILEHQAQYLNRVERDEARIKQLEDAFATLVRIAQISDERQDNLEERSGTITERQDTFEEQIGIVNEKLAALAETHALVDTKLADLAESQKHTDQKLNALIDVVDRYISKRGNGGAENPQG